MRLMTLLLVLIVIALLTPVGCGGSPAGPSTPPPPRPTPSPAPTPPVMGMPNATAFANLALVRRLEQATGRNAILIFISVGGTTPGGVVALGSAWRYSFGDPRTGQTLYVWAVWSSGSVEFLGQWRDVLHLDFTELGPYLAVDSDRAIRVAKKNGAQAYLDRYPDLHVGMTCRFQGRRPVWEILFEGRPPAPCDPGPFYIDVQTGELLGRDLICYDRLPK